MRSMLLAAAMVMAVPGLATACPLCFESSGSGTLFGFYLSTILLTAMPFALIGLVAFLALADRRVCIGADGSAAPVKRGRQAGDGKNSGGATFADAAD